MNRRHYSKIAEAYLLGSDYGCLEPETGKCIQVKKGKLIIDGIYDKEGLFTGIQKEYNEDGTIKMVRDFKDGEIHGYVKVWDDVKLISNFLCENGKIKKDLLSVEKYNNIKSEVYSVSGSRKKYENH